MYFSHLKNGTSNYIFRYQENIQSIDEFNYHPICKVIVANKASDPITNTIHYERLSIVPHTRRRPRYELVN